MLNDVTTHFKKRLHSTIAILLGGCAIFLLWAIVFFLTDLTYWLDYIHFIGAFYFLFSLLAGGILLTLVLATTIYQYKQFIADLSFRRASCAMIAMISFSITIAYGMAMTVSYSLSRLEIKVENRTVRKIESATINYSENKTALIKNIAPGEEKRVPIFLRGTKPMFITVEFSDGKTRMRKQLPDIYNEGSYAPILKVIVMDSDISFQEIRK